MSATIIWVIVGARCWAIADSSIASDRNVILLGCSSFKKNYYIQENAQPSAV